MLNVVIDFLHGTLDLLGCLGGSTDNAALRMKVGATLYCSLFILGEPLYISCLVQSKNPPMDFVVGNKGGLCELEKI